MKKNKLILMICSLLCVVLSIGVISVAVFHKEPKHKHVLNDAKTYHICNDHVYYTRQCHDGCEVIFETKATFADAVMGVTKDDKIVLDEDVVLNQEVFVQSFVGSGANTEDLELTINIDLNNYTLSNYVADKEYDSMFMFSANRGKINFNIQNGKINTAYSSYIFKFKNTKYSGENIVLNINNVECETSGIQTSPIFASNAYNMVINATDCKFKSNTTGKQNGDFGVGAFINSDSVFNFNNCYFEGGDGLYVRRGKVNLLGCTLVNEGLVAHDSQSTDKFSAVGACLVADSHNTINGVSEFSIIIQNCSMQGNASFKMIYVIETKSQNDLNLDISDNSIVDVRSCRFNNNPTTLAIPQYDIVKYPNNESPSNNGTQTWICGNMPVNN